MTILNLHEAIDPALSIIEEAFNKLDSDISAMFTDGVIEALSTIYGNKEDWQRIYQRLKKYRIASDVKKQVIIFLRKSKFRKSTTLNTSATGLGSEEHCPILKEHPSNTEPKIGYNSFVEINEETGSAMLVVESLAAERLREVLLGFLAYDLKTQTWYEFSSNHWKPLNSSQLPDKKIISLLYSGAGDLGFKSCYKNGIKSLLADGGMLPLPETNHEKLPFSNGLLDLKTRQLEPIIPDNAQTWCLPYEYQADADCPTIKAWLEHTVDNDLGTIDFLQAWMAAVLHGRKDLQKFLHLKGGGGTGKGVFMRLLTALVGKENTVITNLEQLERNRFEAATLYNKRLALITESDKYGGSINNLKAITGQDGIRLERKHQQQAGSFTFKGLVVIASNESMQVTDHTSGLDRRRITVIFNRRATAEEKLDWQFRGGEETVLHSELPGLVNWLLKLSQEDITRIIRNPPARIRAADFAAMTASNPIADWLIECTEIDPQAWTQIGDKREIRGSGQETIYENASLWLYASFLQWCSRAHKTPLAIRRFREILIQTCETLNMDVYESRRSIGIGVCGLRLKKNERRD